MNPVFPIPLVQYKMRSFIVIIIFLSLTIFYDYELN